MTRARSILERFAWTATAAFVGVLPATLPLTANNARAVLWAGAAAAIAATISLAKNLVLTPAATTNLYERALWTFLQAGVGALPGTLELSGHALRAVLYAALGAGVAALVSLAKTLTLTPAVSILRSDGTLVAPTPLPGPTAAVAAVAPAPAPGPAVAPVPPLPPPPA